MNPIKRLHSSLGHKNANKSRKIEAAVVGTSSITSFFRIQDSSADIPVAAAVWEKCKPSRRRSMMRHALRGQNELT